MRHLKTITAAVFTAIAVTNIPVAQASPETDFLDGLNAHGILVYDAGTAVNTGWTLCGAMNNANGAQVAEAFYQVTGWDVPDRNTAAIWVIEAANHLCPWHLPSNPVDNRRVIA
jgi:hypothetical protein